MLCPHSAGVAKGCGDSCASCAGATRRRSCVPRVRRSAARVTAPAGDAGMRMAGVGHEDECGYGYHRRRQPHELGCLGLVLGMRYHRPRRVVQPRTGTRPGSAAEPWPCLHARSGPAQRRRRRQCQRAAATSRPAVPASREAACEHGVLTAEDVARAERELGLSAGGTAA
jgi:hypothetical protein